MITRPRRKLRQDQKRGRPLKDWTGVRHGRLVFKMCEWVPCRRDQLWLLKCDCGNFVRARVSNVFAKRSPTLSCGCYNNDLKFMMMMDLNRNPTARMKRERLAAGK